MKDSESKKDLPRVSPSLSPQLNTASIEQAQNGPSENVDCVVIGAGVVGLAVARELALQGREVIILESENLFGSVTSARNSEVIHAGIYYPAFSLKARLCVEGKELLYRYCEQHHIQHQRCGKLIVASDETQKNTLKDIKCRAEVNGVMDLGLLSREEVRTIEPEINAVAALASPSTGIVDSHGFMLSLLGDAQAAGAMLSYASTVCGLRSEGQKITVLVAGEEPMQLQANTVINSAGLNAIDVASGCDALPSGHVPEQVLAKGSYFALAIAAPVSCLIYPVPEPGGLGVHITLDLAGRARFGPDVEWVDCIDYTVDPARAESFYAAIRSYWPGLPDNALLPEYAGMRPKIAYSGEMEADFVISGPAEHGVAGLINLFGIESPGLTASLAIAAEVRRLL